MPSLDSLPVPLLLELASHLEDREEFPSPWNRFTQNCVAPAVSASKALISLSSTCKRLREVFEEKVFGCLSVGEMVEDVIATSAILEVAPLLPKGIEALAECMKNMVHLEKIVWASSLPLPPLFVTVLKKLDCFHALDFEAGCVESHPHILPLVDKLTDVDFESEILPSLPAASIKLCPVTVASRRRSKKKWDERNLPTPQEQTDAFVKGLAAYLPLAADTLESLMINGAGIAPDVEDPGYLRDPAANWFHNLFDTMAGTTQQRIYLDFPRLTRLCIKVAKVDCVAITHLLKARAESFTHLQLDGNDRKTYASPPRAFPRLEYFCTIFYDEVKVAKFVKKVVASPKLAYLNLNGLRPDEVGQIFGSTMACRETLRELNLQSLQTEGLRVGQMNLVARSCPNLEVLKLRATWAGEAIDFLHALKPLKKLRFLLFDHPWEKGRDWPFPDPDGRTIRSERDGDFRIVSCFGTSMEVEIRRRILEDIAAVRPMYKSRFLAFASDHPRLVFVDWHATEAVQWHWRFKRVGDKVEVESDKAHVSYEEEAAAERQQGGAGAGGQGWGGVFMRLPRNA